MCQQHGSKLVVTGWAPCHTPQQGTDPCHQLQLTEFARQWALEVQLLGTQCKLTKELLQGHGFAISHGSFKDETGAAAWIIK